MKQLLWYQPNGEGVAYHCSAKCGSQTLMKGLLKKYGIKDPGFGKRRATLHYELVKPRRIKASVVPEAYSSIQFVRHPKDRFESLWRWGCRDRNQGIPAALWDESPDALLWHIMDNLYDNEHWCPQSVVTPLATVVLPIERLSDFFPKSGKANKTKPGPIPEYDQDLLNQLYALDKTVWNFAKEN